MRYNFGSPFCYLFIVFLTWAGSGVMEAQEKPNIVVILTDDQGYADISFNPHHPTEVHTPNMDSLAQEGIFFSQAYTSGNTCSPTRAGLMTGRYQQRAGIYDSGEGGSGLPLDKTVIPQYLTPEGYVCGAFGKWHLGLTEEYNPISRGFNEFFGFMGRGAHDYYDLDNPDSPLYRGLETTTAEGYLTNLLTDEAVDFIKRHKAEPFFCYLAYNAVHSPAQAPAEDIADFDTGDPDRDILMAMLRHLDNGVGDVVRTLKSEGLWDNTLLIFLTDNGGSGAMKANNAPLRDFKQTNWEGGIRTPFVISWPAKYPGGRTISTPVISLDILPTILDAVGVDEPADEPLDGKSILPLLEGETKPLHDMLFWSEGGIEGEWAVRYGKWKLVTIKDKLELFDLEADISESNNLASTYPDTLDKMVIAYEAWLDEMAEPKQTPSKRWSPPLGSGQLMALYDGLYYSGESQSFDEEGLYNTEDLVGIGDKTTRSVVLASGFETAVFNEDKLGGEDTLFRSGAPYMGAFDRSLSSLVLYQDVCQNMSNLDISASLSPETAPNTVDGDLSTYWEVAEKGSWIQYSFDREAKVEGINIAFKRGHLRVAYFDVDVSLDGASWTPVITGGASNGTQKTLEEFSFPGVTAKHVRITGYGNSDNNQNHYTEVEFVFGEVPVPENRFEAEDFNRGSNISKTFANDACQGILAIEMKNESSSEYDLSFGSASSYKMNIRLKTIQAGDIEIKTNGTLQATLSIREEMADDNWYTYARTVNLPEGDFTLSLHGKGSDENSQFEVNWFEFSTAVSSDEAQLNWNSHLKIYPNPCTNLLNITAGSEMVRIRILDVRGTLIREMKENGERISIPTSNLARGIYFLQINTSKGIQFMKFIKS